MRLTYRGKPEKVPPRPAGLGPGGLRENLLDSHHFLQHRSGRRGVAARTSPREEPHENQPGLCPHLQIGGDATCPASPHMKMKGASGEESLQEAQSAEMLNGWRQAQ